MSKFEKILGKILRGTSDTNISFEELCYTAESLGFSKRVKGGHHVYYRSDIEEILNFQPKGTKAKPYQVRQLRNIILKYKIGEKDGK